MRSLIYISIFLIATGCATKGTSPPQADSPFAQAAIAKDEELFRRAQSRGRAAFVSLDGKPIISGPEAQLSYRTPNPKIEVFPGYRKFSERYSFCSPDEERDGPSAVEAGFSKACIQNGGRLEGKFCRDSSRRDRVAFIAKTVAANGACNGVLAIMFVPTTNPVSNEYTRLLAQESFVSDQEITQETKSRSERIARENELERSRIARDWPRMRVRGAMVCTVQNGNRFTAFVEEFTEDKLKLTINKNTSRTGAPTIDFQQASIWTDGTGWAPC